MLIKNPRFLYLIFALVLLAGVPSFAMSFFGLGSLAVGDFFIAILISVFCVKFFKRILSVRVELVRICFYILIYAVIQHVFVGFWWSKSYYSLFPLLVVLFSAYLASRSLGAYSSDDLKNSSLTMFFLLSGVALINIIYDYKIGLIFGYTHNKSIFPFLEPSHFSLFFGIFFLIAFVLASSYLKKTIYMLMILFFALFIQNTTALMYFLIAFFLLMASLGKGRIILLAPILLLLLSVILFFVFSDSYFSQRFNFSIESNNATALVYLQGFDDAKNSFFSTGGLGLGFQMLGSQPPSIYAYSIARALGSINGELNRQDGGFLAAKVIAEFGFLGIIFLLAYLRLFIQCFFSLVSCKSLIFSKQDVRLVVPKIIIVAFSVEIFGRSAGYFSPGFYIFFASLFLLLAQRNRVR